MYKKRGRIFIVKALVFFNFAFFNKEESTRYKKIDTLKKNWEEKKEHSNCSHILGSLWNAQHKSIAWKSIYIFIITHKYDLTVFFSPLAFFFFFRRLLIRRRIKIQKGTRIRDFVCEKLKKYRLFLNDDKKEEFCNSTDVFYKCGY